MVPLMMQRGYKPKGWLGLILGTKLYYEFFAAAVDTDDKFMKQMDALTREIGDRGRVKQTTAGARVVVSEGVPPAPAPAPAPRALAPLVPAPAPAPATPPRSAALVPSAATDQGYSPSVHMLPMQSSSADALGMVERLLDEAKADRAAMEARLEAKDAKDAKMEAKLAEQRQEMEAKLEATYAKAAEEKANMEAKMEAKVAELTAPAPAAISDDQVAALQARLEALNAAKLLSDEVRAPYSNAATRFTRTIIRHDCGLLLLQVQGCDCVTDVGLTWLGRGCRCLVHLDIKNCSKVRGVWSMVDGGRCPVVVWHGATLSRLAFAL